MADVLIVMGSDSDLPVMKEAAVFLDKLQISYHMSIVSAHRTPDRLAEVSGNAENKGYKVIIAGAGGAAHLPGMVASFSTLPVIGVPVKSSNLSGVDSLYSIVQMPPGVPVASMAINGALNAGIFAAQIIGSSDKEILQKVKAFKEEMKNTVEVKAKHLEDDGYEIYLKKMQ